MASEWQTACYLAHWRDEYDARRYTNIYVVNRLVNKFQQKS